MKPQTVINRHAQFFYCLTMGAGQLGIELGDWQYFFVFHKGIPEIQL